mmetsp:Transcript_9342/g.16896  ORF Transcript_9342/g.16896 Transcript_9342/m.16896 type:complete len:619 (-) Transcript_9342:72-1928(-)
MRWLIAAGILLGTLPLCTIARLGSEAALDGPADVLNGGDSPESSDAVVSRATAEDNSDKDTGDDKADDKANDKGDDKGDEKGDDKPKEQKVSDSGKDAGKEDKDKDKDNATKGKAGDNSTATNSTKAKAAEEKGGQQKKHDEKKEKPKSMTPEEIEAHAKKVYKELDDKLDWKVTEKDWVKLQLSSCLTLDDCGKGKVLKSDAGNLFCEKEKCSDKDQGTCCAAPAKCSTYKCPSGLVSKPAAPTCTSDKCGPQDALTCCQEKAACNPFACTPAFAIVPFTNATCAGPTCDPSKDQKACCVPKMSCMNFTCPSGQQVKAGPPLCATNNCTPADALTCCQPLPTCATLAIPPNFTMCPWGTFLADNPTSMFCGPAGCNATDIAKCCPPRATCDNFSCPTPAYYNLSSQEEGPLYCTKGVCDPVADTPKCCKARRLCYNFSCPKHYTNKMDDDDSEPAYCESDVCQDSDVDACCDEPHSGGWLWKLAAVLVALVALCLVVACAAYIVQMDPKKIMGGGSGSSGAAYSRTGVSPEDAAAQEARGRPGPDRPPSAASDPPTGLGGLGGVDGPPQRRAGPGASGTGPRSGPGASGGTGPTGPGRGPSGEGGEGGATNAAPGER